MLAVGSVRLPTGTGRAAASLTAGGGHGGPLTAHYASSAGVGSSSVSGRVDLVAVRERLLQLLALKFHDYWDALKRMVAGKLSKDELDARLAELLTAPHAVQLHNQLISGLVHNAYSKTHPPPPVPLPERPSTYGRDGSKSGKRRRASASSGVGSKKGKAGKAGKKADAAPTTLPAAAAAAAGPLATPRHALPTKRMNAIGPGIDGALAGDVPYHGARYSSLIRLDDEAGLERQAKRRRMADAKSAGDFSVMQDSQFDPFAPPKEMDLPDFAALRAQMLKVAARTEIGTINDNAVVLTMYAMETYLKNIIARCVQLHRPARPLLIRDADSGKEEQTSSRHIVTTQDLLVVSKLAPQLLGEGRQFACAKIQAAVQREHGFIHMHRRAPGAIEEEEDEDDEDDEEDEEEEEDDDDDEGETGDEAVTPRGRKRGRASAKSRGSKKVTTVPETPTRSAASSLRKKRRRASDDESSTATSSKRGSGTPRRR